MTEEQKDWFEYGRLKAGWLIAKKLDPGEERTLTPFVWAARKKAHRWLHTNCDNCKFSELDVNQYPCISCFGTRGCWEPKS